MITDEFYMSIYTPYKRRIKTSFKHLTVIMEFPGLYFSVTYNGPDWKYKDQILQFHRDSMRFLFGKCEYVTGSGKPCNYYAKYQTPPMFGHSNTKRVCGVHKNCIEGVTEGLGESRKCSRLWDGFFRII